MKSHHRRDRSAARQAERQLLIRYQRWALPERSA